MCNKTDSIAKVPVPLTATTGHNRAGATIRANNRAPSLKLTRKQVLERSDPDELCLIIVDKYVYNVTKFLTNHPGGKLTLHALCGRDATEPFYANHPTFVTAFMKKFLYATLTLESKSDTDADVNDAKLLELDPVTVGYRDLTEKMKEAGLFETDYTFYYKKVAWFATLFSTVLAGIFLSDSFAVHLVSAALLGLFWQQVAFLGHDIGHNGVTHDRIKDSQLGLFFGNFCTGIGMGWWKHGHNVHHVVTNSLEHDPDIQHLPIFAIHEKYLTSYIYSTYHKSVLVLNKLTHVLVKYQHFLYYPVMAFARINLYVQSILHVAQVGAYDTKEQLYRRDLQALALVGFWTWLVALTLSLPNWFERVCFFILAHNVAGILHIQITLSHFGMEAFDEDEYFIDYDDPDKCGFVSLQMRTSMDIDCPTYLDWFHGGLQFQVVHHLWPRLPRHNLRQVQQLLMSFAKEHGLVYHHMNFLEANKRTINVLKRTAKTSKSFNELFVDSWNMEG